MQTQRDVGVLGCIFGCTVDRHLFEGNALGALAGNIVVTDRCDVQMSPREIVHVMRFVRFKDVGLEQRIVLNTVQHHIVIGERMLVVFEVLSQLFPGGIGEPRSQSAQRRIAVELVRRTRVSMTERYVARMSRRHRK